MSYGRTRLGAAWQGWARVDDVSTEGFGPLCCLHWRQMRCCQFWPGREWHGQVGCDWTGLGKGYRRWHGGVFPPCHPHGWTWRHKACSGALRHGEARSGLFMRGLATADDLSTEPFGALCWVLLNPVLVRRGKARPGKLRLGVTRRATVN